MKILRCMTFCFIFACILQGTLISQPEAEQPLYCFKRLEKPLLLLNKLVENNFRPKQSWHYSDVITFKHPLIIQCMHSMHSQKNLEPLLNLSQSISYYHYFNDTELFRQYLLLMFVVYKNIFVDYAQRRGSFALYSIQDIITLYKRIESFPLDEILYSIDLLTNQLPYLIEYYELNSDLTWKTWFRKYWWLPALCIAITGIKIIHKKVNNLEPQKLKD